MKHASASLQTTEAQLRRSFLPLLGYLLLALILTWPLVRYFATHAPGDGSDDPAIIWNLWWVRFALLNGYMPLQSEFMFWPLGVDLVFYTLTTLNALITLPLQLTIGLIPANSLLVWFELVVGALGAFYLTRRLTGGWWGPFLAGLIFSFTHSRFVFLSLGQFNIAGSHWVPWYVLALWRLERTGTLRDAGIAALFLLANGWTEFTYASFLVLFTAFHWLWHRVRDLQSRELARALRQTGLHALIGILFAAGLSPVLWTMLRTIQREGDFLVEGLGFANVFSADLLGFLVPSHLHPLLGDWVQDSFNFAYLNFAYLSYVALLLAMVALVHRRTRRQAGFWAVAALAFIALSLGPTLRVNGQEFHLPMPFDLMLQMPIFKANRYPSRYSVMVALCFTVLAAYGLAALHDWIYRQSHRVQRSTSSIAPRTTRHIVNRTAYNAAHRQSLVVNRTWGGIVTVLIILFLVETVAIPLPLSDYRVPALYHDLHERDTTAVLEIPMAWRNGFRVTGPLDNTFMFAQYYQTVHEKRLLNGNTSRNPEFLFQYFTEAPFLNSLLALETGHDVPAGRQSFDTAVAPQALQLLGIEEIVVHSPRSDDPAVTPRATVPYLEEVLSLEQWHDGEQHDAWHVELPELPAQVSIDGTGSLARLHFGAGWGALPPFTNAPQLSSIPTVWAQRPEAEVFVALDGSAERVQFSMYSPEAQTVTLRANDGPAISVAVQQGTGEYGAQLPGLHAGHNRVHFRFERMWLVSEAVTPSDSAPASIVVESAGQEVGDFAHIYVDGEDVAPNDVGYNFAIIHPETGEVLDTAAFNTAFEEPASQQLADFIAQVPDGHIVAGAVQDTADWPAAQGGPSLLDEQALAALRSIGADVSLDETFRWSHAVLGVKGATPGSATEDASAIRPARVWTGELITDPRVAAGIQWIDFSP